MMTGIICFVVIGALIAFLFTLLMVNFDGKWKLLLEGFLGIGGNGIALVGLFDLFSVEEQNMRFAFTTALICGFLVSVVIMLRIMCYVIKDKDDKDILRIRDILLGQKSYIEKYYEQRMTEIDNRLNIPLLLEREQKVEQRERAVREEEKYLSAEADRVAELGNKKLKINLPADKKITLTERFVSLLPSYIGDFSRYINGMNNNTELFLIKGNSVKYNMEDLKTYLLSFLMVMSAYIFGKSNDIRVHFRYYNEETEKYEMLMSVVGNSVSDKSMTPIPFEGSMIENLLSVKEY